MTDDFAAWIKELNEVCEKATPGPWHSKHRFADWGFPYVVYVGDSEDPEESPVAECRFQGGTVACFANTANIRKCELEAANGQLIALSRTALPKLIEIVEAGERFVKAWDDYVNGMDVPRTSEERAQEYEDYKQAKADYEEAKRR